MTMRLGLFEAVDAAGVRTFGDLVTVRFHDLPAVVVDGVFEAPGERALVIDGFPVASSTPAIGLHVPDLPRLPGPGDTVTRGGIEYQVGEVTPDGQGGVSVELVRPQPVSI